MNEDGGVVVAAVADEELRWSGEKMEVVLVAELQEVRE